MLIKTTTVFPNEQNAVWLLSTSTSGLFEYTTHVQRSFVQDYLGEPVPEETFIHSHPWGRRRIRTDNKVCFEPIKPAYDQSQLNASDYWSVCRQFWSQYLLLCRTRCILYQLPPLLLAIFWILWKKITQADAPTIHLDATPSGISVSYLHHPPFYAECPFLPQPSQFSLAWDIYTE